MSRASSYTDEIAATICERLADGESLGSICKSEGMPGQSTVFRWLSEIVSFREMYTRAREQQAETLADQIVAIADETENDYFIDENGNERVNAEAIARSRLRVDARKWVAAKLKPRVYGDRVTTEHTGEVGIRSVTRRIIDGRSDPDAEGV